MKFYFITPKQKILVDPFAYVGNQVSCLIPETDIAFKVTIDKLETENGGRVTSKILTDLWMQE